MFVSKTHGFTKVELLACGTHYLFSLIQDIQALPYSVKLTYYVLVIVILFG